MVWGGHRDSWSRQVVGLVPRAIVAVLLAAILVAAPAAVGRAAAETADGVASQANAPVSPAEPVTGGSRRAGGSVDTAATTNGSDLDRPGLILEDIQIEGDARTRRETVLQAAGLHPGQPITQAELLDAVASLRASGLFGSVDFHTRPGARRGWLILVLEVQPNGLDLRLGTGYSDLSGWYLIPAELALDNRLGRGESLQLQAKIGYRLAGLVLSLDEEHLGGGSGTWGLAGSVFQTDRLYFLDDVEYDHKVMRSALDVHWGQRLAPAWASEFGMRLERVEADSFATVHATDEARGAERGDQLPFDHLPPSIARDAGARSRTTLSWELRADSRRRLQVVGTPAGGLWGRLRLQGTLQGDRSFAAWGVDVRGYRAWLGGVLAARLRAGGVGSSAAFYDRHYLGGLYTLRGFPNQSLSAPEGDTHFWSATCEWRAPLIGRGERARLAGALFVDAGDSWTHAAPTLAAAAASAGYGVRWRVGWLGWIGLDVAAPLSASPVGDAFDIHASIGWTF